MRFSIEPLSENGLDLLLLKDELQKTTISIVPGSGAMLSGFSILLNGKKTGVIDGYRSLQELQQKHDYFKSSKLSPFPCRIRDGKYTFDGKIFEFKNKFKDGNALHGLLVDKSFTITNQEADENKASVSLEYFYRKDDDAFPFDYKCEINYVLEAEHTLTIRTIVTGQSSKPIPMADGWHPYFQLGGKLNDWMLRFNAESMIEFDDKLIPTGRTLPYHAFNSSKEIGNSYFDNCFLLTPGNGEPACSLYNPQNQISLNIYPDKSYPYLQIYTPDHRDSIAIENLSAAPDCFNNGMGLILLGPLASQTFTVQYRIDHP